jgi:hypothetical protein
MFSPILSNQYSFLPLLNLKLKKTINKILGKSNSGTSWKKTIPSKEFELVKNIHSTNHKSLDITPFSLWTTLKIFYPGNPFPPVIIFINRSILFPFDI